MSHHALHSAAPLEPYQWHESVMSTRSLSYLSTVDAFGLADSSTRSRSGSLNTRPTRSSTMHEDDDLVMANTSTNHSSAARGQADTGLSDIPELPDSVAHSPLFALPRELRDRIYTYCLTARDHLPIAWPRAAGTPQTHNPASSHGLQPALLRTCHLLHAEAAPLLYSLNTLAFHYPSDANIFVRAYADTRLGRRWIRSAALYIKATDTRLWMPYLTSADAHRSLRADFPGLRDLGVRYRSNRWNHAHTAVQNLEELGEDGRLEELVEGLRGVYFPPRAPAATGSAAYAGAGRRGDGAEGGRTLDETDAAETLANMRRANEDAHAKRHLHQPHGPLAQQQQQTPPAPTIRVLCACRVHKPHFDQLAPARDAQRLPTTLAQSARDGPGARTVSSPTTNIPPLREGEPFRVFQRQDFAQLSSSSSSTSTTVILADPTLGPTARVARTAFADRGGVGVGLEIHTLESGSGGRERRAAA
ncbi:hypothetical protein LTR53_002531 [Teratosphaeriaceae sp. CCFEE 6253]|nr:hypothetical protein LTR53_002531 [Teratosphaeriaceae sp. CCFEE 6253]